MMEPRIREAAHALLMRAGYGPPTRVELLPGGRNNRAYRVECAEAPLFLKAYHHDASDPRNRLSAEYAFLTYAWSRGIRNIPRPIGACPAEHLGLYQFYSGAPPAAGETGEAEIEQAITLFERLNVGRERGHGHIGYASEACFSIAAHIESIVGRVDRLARIGTRSSEDEEARAFVRRALRPRLETVVGSIRDTLRRDECEREIPEAARCLSPSDFGFHNTLRDAGGELIFIDFEYAGWDDPARMTCDFFLQPQIPAGSGHRPRFCERIAPLFPDADDFARRTELIFPLYKIKWCSIMLNEFVPAGARRRAFARGGGSDAQIKRRQLVRARTLLETV